MKVTTTNTKTKKIVTIEKDVFSLYPKTMSLDEAVEKLKSLIPNLKLHIYTEERQEIKTLYIGKTLQHE